MTAHGKYMTITGLLAGTSVLAGKQYFAVKAASTAGEVVLATSATSKVLGILMNDPADGEPAEIAFLGEAKAVADGSVTYGSFLTANSSGRLTDTTTANDRVVAIALETDNASGDLVRVQLCGGSNY